MVMAGLFGICSMVGVLQDPESTFSVSGFMWKMMGIGTKFEDVLPCCVTAGSSLLLAFSLCSCSMPLYVESLGPDL